MAYKIERSRLDHEQLVQNTLMNWNYQDHDLHRREEGAKEELGVRVTFDVEQRDPRHALLRHLVHNHFNS